MKGLSMPLGLLARTTSYIRTNAHSNGNILGKGFFSELQSN